MQTRDAGKTNCHPHSIGAFGYLRSSANGRTTRPNPRARTIQLMLGHADIKHTQRYLNITDEELRKAITGVWERRRQLRAVSQ